MFCLGIIDLEDESSTFGIIWIFPSRFDSISEKIDRINFPFLSINLIAKLGEKYVGQMLWPPYGLSTTKKLFKDL